MRRLFIPGLLSAALVVGTCAVHRVAGPELAFAQPAQCHGMPCSLIPRRISAPNRDPGDSGWRARGEHNANGMGAAMRCVRGLPDVEPPVSGLTERERDEAIVHEIVHEMQFSPNCDSIMGLWDSIPYYRLALESQATCLGLQVWQSDSARSSRQMRAATRISQANGNQIPFEDITAMLDRFCGRT